MYVYVCVLYVYVCVCMFMKKEIEFQHMYALRDKLLNDFYDRSADTDVKNTHALETKEDNVSDDGESGESEQPEEDELTSEDA